MGRLKKEGTESVESAPVLKKLNEEDIVWAEQELERLKAEKNKREFIQTAQQKIEELEKFVALHHKYIQELNDRVNEMFAQLNMKK